MIRIISPTMLCFLLLLTLLTWVKPIHAQAYCYLREMKVSTLKNGVQLSLRADGILSWNWNTAVNVPVTRAFLRFNSTRMGLDKNFYTINQDPLSTVNFTETTDGKSVDMTMELTKSSRLTATLSDDRQTLIISIFSTFTDESTRPIGPAPALQAGSFTVTPHDGLVDVVAVKTSIQQLVSEIARLCELNVAVHDSVRHDVSINVSNRLPVEVLQSIAAGYGLALSNENGVYMLSEGVPADLPTYQRSGTASFPMKYLRASDAKNLLPSFLFMYIRDNGLQNAVVVTAPSQMVDKIGRDLKSIDQPPSQVLIECAVVELSNENDFLTQFKASFQDQSHDISLNSTTGSASYKQVAFDPAISTAISATPILQATLRALITKGKAVVNAHPSMAAMNGKTAEIFVGSQRYIKITTQSGTTSTDRLETVPVGTLLRIVPSTSGTKEITCSITVEMSNIVQVDPQTGIPRVSKRTMSTNLRTRDGDTIILGGLSLHQTDHTHQRIPILGDIPLIGSLFRSSSIATDTTELVVLIRPRLLDANGHLPSTEEIIKRDHFMQPGDLGYPKENDPTSKVDPAAFNELMNGADTSNTNTNK